MHDRRVSEQAATSERTVIMTQPTAVVVGVNLYGNLPVYVRCSHCQQMTTTRIEYQTGGATWVACAITALVG